MLNELYEQTVRRLARAGVKDPTSQIIFLAEEIERYREKIRGMEGLLAARGAPPVVPAKPLEDWGEDHGDVLWWKFPVEEPPYVGSPLDAFWPGYHTHWTPLPEVPEAPDESL